MPSPDELDVEITVDASVDVPGDVTETAIASLATHVLAAEGQEGAWQLGIQFVDDASMQLAHAEFMGIDVPTDIMTFPYEGNQFGLMPGDEVLPERGGDLMISVDRAADHASAAGWSTADELFFLIAHGMLHILGWDDATDEDRRAMLARQSELMSSWHRP